MGMLPVYTSHSACQTLTQSLLPILTLTITSLSIPNSTYSNKPPRNGIHRLFKADTEVHFLPLSLSNHPNPMQTGSKFMSFPLMQAAPGCDHHFSGALQKTPLIAAPCVHSRPLPIHPHTAAREDFVKCTRGWVTWLHESLRWLPWFR